MEISFKRVSACIILMLALTISPIFLSNSNTVHAAKQDDLAKVAQKRLGERQYNCSLFVWQSAKKAKLMNGKTFPKKSVGGTNDIQRYFTKKNQYNKATSSFKVEKGDLAIFGSSTHIGIVTKAKGNYVWITHGNWAGKVRITKIKKSGYDGNARARIKGYVRLDYKASEPNITVKFDANDGQVDVASKKIKNTSKVGELPTATKENMEFMGWFTKAEGGKLVTADYKVDVKKSITLYAQYKEPGTTEDTAPTTPTK